MRSIAKIVDISLSNIYNYFKNKSEILKTILQPLLDELDHMMEDHNNDSVMNKEYFLSEHSVKHETDKMVRLTTCYSDELNLLLFKSNGSDFENFKEEYINKHTKVSIEYFEKMHKKYPATRFQYSEFFLHTMSSWWLSIVGEIVSHKLNQEEIEEFYTDYTVFAIAGWKKIMNM